MRNTKKIYLLLVVLSGLFLFNGCYARAREEVKVIQEDIETEANFYTSGYLDYEGNLNFYDEKQEILHKLSGYNRGYWMLNREIFLLESNDQEFVIMDENGDNRQVIDTDIMVLYAVRENGLIYRVKSTDETASFILKRYLFDTDEILTLGTDSSHVLALNSMNVLYEDNSGVYILREDKSEAELVEVHVDESITLIGISNNGEVAAWGTEKNKLCTMYVYYDDKVEIVGNFEWERDYFSYGFAFTPDNNFVLWENEDSVLYIKASGVNLKAIEISDGRYISVHFPRNKVISSNVYERTYQVKNLDDIFANRVDKEFNTGYTLYHIDKNGQKYKIISEVSKAAFIDNDMIYYRDINGNLFAAKYNGKKVSKSKKVATEVLEFSISNDGKYLYYEQKDDTEISQSNLYYSENGSKPIKVASEINYGTTFSESGKSVSFFKESHYFGESRTTKGTLYVYTIGGEVKKVADDVLLYDLKWMSDANGEFCRYQKYVEVLGENYDEYGFLQEEYLYDKYEYKNGNSQKISGSYVGESLIIR